MTALQQILVALVPSLLVAVLTAWLTVRLTLRQFYAQRWWEKKAEAYSAVTEALYHAKVYAEALMREHETGKDISAERRKELAEQSSKSSEVIDSVVATKAYIISGDALRVLAELQKARDKAFGNPNWYEMLDWDAAALKTCLDQMHELARKELGMK